MYMTVDPSALVLQTSQMEFPQKRTVVASDESITITPPGLAVHVLLRLLERNVHVSINRLQFTYRAQH